MSLHFHSNGNPQILNQHDIREPSGSLAGPSRVTAQSSLLTWSPCLWETVCMSWRETFPVECDVSWQYKAVQAGLFI